MRLDSEWPSSVANALLMVAARWVWTGVNCLLLLFLLLIKMLLLL